MTTTKEHLTTDVLVKIIYLGGHTYYRLPADIAAQVIPTGYYGWDDCDTQAHVITDHSKRQQLLKNPIRLIENVADALMYVRGYGL